ncbi:MAG: S8 family serine peptidase [Candidatus Methanoperedens sp.]|nr:S8 family serine peptidase [Candidatus Methanoperedens sp.]
MDSFHLLKRIKIKLADVKVLLYFCVIIMMMTGVALAADREVIVGFSKTISSDKEKKIEIENYNGTVKKNFHIINAASAKVPEEKIDAMKNNPRIKYVVNNTKYEMSDEYTSSWGVQYIGSQNVHNQDVNGAGINITVLDTGIDYNHPDLTGNYKGGYDFVFNDADPWDDNCLSYYKTCHGTHVSGIIAAENNGLGIIGVAPKSNIYAAKVLDGGGFGAADMIISGIEWAMGNGSNIISMSLQSPEDNIALVEAINAAYNQGILIVAAGGNTYGGNVVYPAAYDNVIAVTAIDQNAQRASFSPIDQKIELAAPGVNINSTVSDCTLTPPIVCTENYKSLSGTSMAAPYITGVAALVYSTDYPDVNGDGIRNNTDVRKILQDSALDVGIAGRDNIYGYGIVDASKAVLGYSTYADLSVTIDDGISNITAGDGNLYNYTITIKNKGPGDASSVRIFDKWPDEFIRNSITPSQGVCDTLMNFTCDLGDIVNGGTATVIAQYIIPASAYAGSYINTVEVNSTNTDYNTGNNIARDNNTVNEFNITLNLIKTNRICDLNKFSIDRLYTCDAQKATLTKGNYSIIINNINLIGVDINVYKDGDLKRDLSSKYILSRSPVVNTNMTVNWSKLDIVFIPYGVKGSTAQVIIRNI